MASDSKQFDVIVVGGSFAGLSAAMQLARARRRVLVLDTGLPRNRFAARSHGFFGQDGKAPLAILQEARSQLLAYRTVEFRQVEALSAAPAKAGFVVSLESGGEAHAERLVLATGVVDELPPIPGVAERWGKTVLHCPYCHGYEVAGSRLGVLALSDVSIHQALLVRDWGEVTLFTNGTMRLTEEQQARLNQSGVRMDHRPIHHLSGRPPELEGIQVEGEMVPLDALYTASRTRMASPLADQLGCAFDEGPFGPVIRTDEFKQTTIAGVYAAGDAARARHNATWASADGVSAGVAAHQSLVLPAAR